MSIKPFLNLIRLDQTIMSLLIASIGYFFVTFEIRTELIYLLFGILFIHFALFASNDYFDLKEDKFNKRKDRPLVTQKIKPVNVLIFSIISTIIGLFLLFLINITCFAIGLLAILGWFYNIKIKKIALVGEFTIGILIPASLLVGYFTTTNQITKPIIIIYLIMMLTTITREIIKNTQEIEGDKKAKRQTSPVKFGIENCNKICYLLITFSIILIIYLFTITTKLSLIYLILAILSMIILIISLKQTNKI